jgi:hypothetical protein
MTGFRENQAEAGHRAAGGHDMMIDLPILSDNVHWNLS